MRKRSIINELKLSIPALSVNESACRSIVAAFCAQLDPNIEEISDIKCAVSEAVTNCIVHAYGGRGGIIYITVKLCEGRKIKILIRDCGCGIEDVAQARKPLYTTGARDERSGMGFTVMESFTDKLEVSSKVGVGTRISMTKFLR